MSELVYGVDFSVSNLELGWPQGHNKPKHNGIGKRGPDKKPRRMNPRSLLNLTRQGLGRPKGSRNKR